MTRKEIAQQVAESADISGAAAELATKAVFDAIIAALVAGDKVAIAGFGSFDVRDRPERQGRNPQTGEALTIKASKAAGFKAASALKAALNG